MSLPNKKGMTRILRECYASIGIKFPNDPEDKKLLAFSIETAVEQIDQSSGTTWNAALEAFAGLIQLRCMKWRPANPGPSDKGCVVDGFDETWFTDEENGEGTNADLVEFLRSNAIEL